MLLYVCFAAFDSQFTLIKFMVCGVLYKVKRVHTSVLFKQTKVKASLALYSFLFFNVYDVYFVFTDLNQ